MVYKKSPEEVAAMRRGGRRLVEIMNRLEARLRPGITTRQLDGIAEDLITRAGARSSSRLQGFPGTICISPNDIVVHGVPGPYRLKEGDVVTLDVALFYDGFHVDAAWTYAIGSVDKETLASVSYTHLRAHETDSYLVCRLLLDKKK